MHNRLRLHQRLRRTPKWYANGEFWSLVVLAIIGYFVLVIWLTF